jgi:hypothetical protein
VSSGIRHASRRAAVLAGTAILAIRAGAAPAAAETVPLPVKAVVADDRQTSVVIDLSADPNPGPQSAEVTIDGVRRPAGLVPFMSGDLAVTIVVDTSATDPASVPAWLSAAARFILEAPAGTRAAVIGDAFPATLIATPQQGPTGIVAALDGVRAHGRRDTAAALALAVEQFPEVPPGRRLTVVYTGAADAGGPSATTLGGWFRDAGAMLVVATTADTSPYWSAAAEATGGFFAPAGHPVVVPALDQVETTLRGRYLVRFPTPARRGAAVPLRVTTPGLTLTADVRLPDSGPRTAPDHHGRRSAIALLTTGAVVLGLLVTWWSISRSRRRRPLPIVVAHGRAAVPRTRPPPEP